MLNPKTFAREFPYCTMSKLYIYITDTMRTQSVRETKCLVTPGIGTIGRVPGTRYHRYCTVPGTGSCNDMLIRRFPTTYPYLGTSYRHWYGLPVLSV